MKPLKRKNWMFCYEMRHLHNHILQFTFAETPLFRVQKKMWVTMSLLRGRSAALGDCGCMQIGKFAAFRSLPTPAAKVPPCYPRK